MEDLGVDMSGTENANFTKSTVSTVKRKSILEVEPKKDRESSAIVKSTGQLLKRKAAKHELGLTNIPVSSKFFNLPT